MQLSMVTFSVAPTSYAINEVRATENVTIDNCMVVATHHAVVNGHVLGGADLVERVRALQDDGVVAGRVDRGVGDPHVLAAVDIDPVTVRVDHQAVDPEVVHTRRENVEMAAVDQGDVADSY